MRKYKGLFITFEGSEGAGKTTQIKLLAKYLKKNNIKYITTYEPGGTKISQKIRDLLLEPKNKKITPFTELFLYSAARAQLTSEKIIPKLKQGYVVLCDRYYDSTVAYQGYSRGLNLNIIYKLNKIASYGIVPNLTFILIIPPEIGVKKAKNISSKKGFPETGDRFEGEKLSFHKKVVQGYLKISKKEKRFVVLDGTKDIDTIHKEIIRKVEKLIKTKFHTSHK